jgi:hypothetical protein
MNMTAPNRFHPRPNDVAIRSYSVESWIVIHGIDQGLRDLLTDGHLDEPSARPLYPAVQRPISCDVVLLA